MNKQEYLGELRRFLSKLPQTEVDDIMSDYQEHFDAGKGLGKTEEAISASLGHPRIVAQGHLMTSLINEVSTTPSIIGRSSALFRMVVLFLALAPFNFLVFVGPFVVMLALLVAGWAIPLAVSGGSITGAGAFLLYSSSMGFFSGLSLLFMFLGTLGLSVLGGMIMWLLTRGFIQVVSSYIRWNIKFITARGA